LAETAIIGSAMTKMFFNVNLAEFVTGVTSSSKQGTGYFPGSDGDAITLPELAGFTKNGFRAENIGGNYGNSTFTETVIRNMKANALPSIGVAFLTPIVFRFGKRTFRKPLSMIRKQLKGTGVTV
tara:strand:+ start:468 stop:842 length:375 start_codon:yes stop_codon:yes gene_type:complete